MTHPQASELERVFGVGSLGETPEMRAASSKRTFVRSQAQLSIYTERSKGLQMSAQWALRQFGFATLLRAVNEGAVVISANLSEPARTLQEQREKLGLNFKQIARASGVAESLVRKAEKPGSIVPIRQLLSIAQTLGLNDEKISVQPGAGSDHDLAYRLRTMKNSRHKNGLSPSAVLKLAEAAWVTARQLELEDFLGEGEDFSAFFEKNPDYSPPAWKVGYDLAEETRKRLGLPLTEPIPSIRSVIDGLGIPLIQAPMGYNIAGATVVNGESRGIAVNTEGENTNVWIRRMTLSHELGHLLWDPHEKLKHLHVDRYETISGTVSHDPIEARANAFAISFLIPPNAVKEIISSNNDTASMLATMMDKFGVGAMAAKYHLSNVSKHWGANIDVSDIALSDMPPPNETWNAREDWTVDFFPVPGVSVGRRGKFSGLIATALKRGKISRDTAGSWLGVAPSEIEMHCDDVINLTMPDKSAFVLQTN